MSPVILFGVVAINLALSDARKGRSERSAHRRAQARPPASAVGEPALPDEQLAAALAGLDAEDRAVVVLRFAVDLSVDEVAGILRTPTGTVKTRTRRALAALRAEGIDASADEEVVS